MRNLNCFATNKAKSLLYIPAEADESVNSLPQTIPIVLGCPVGPPDFCEATFQSRVDKIKLSLGLLHTLEDSHAQTTLLRSCLALPKVVSVLRLPPRAALALLLMILTVPFGALLRVSWVDDWSWQKASLPCSKGGLGLRSAPLHAPAAYLDSSLRSASHG